MMPTFPGYDEWKLRGPDEDAAPVEDCPYCDGTGQAIDDGGDPGLCRKCMGDGVIPVEQEEPDGDYLYERYRDQAT